MFVINPNPIHSLLYRPPQPGQLTREAAPTYAASFTAAPLLPAFSRRREVFAGRFAMIGCVCVACA